MRDPFWFFEWDQNFAAGSHQLRGWSTRISSLPWSNRAREERLTEPATQLEKKVSQAFFECRDEDATATYDRCAAIKMQTSYFTEVNKK